MRCGGWRTRYRRDLRQSQPTRLELWTEKEGILAVFADITARYQVPTAGLRGNSSFQLVSGEYRPL